MKKPRNFDKIDKIKFSEIKALIYPDSISQYNKNMEILDMSNITINDITPAHSTYDVNKSKISVYNDDIPNSPTLVMDIDWNDMSISVTVGEYKVTLTNMVYGKKFQHYQALNVHSFVQLCIYPICIHLYYNTVWRPHKVN